MMSKRQLPSICALAALAVFAATLPAFAAPGDPPPPVNIFDHLKCYKITDTIKKLYKVDLIPQQAPPFSIEQGCKLVVPAKFFCIDVRKTNVQPPPPVILNGANTRDFLCYKLTCPGKIDFTQTVRDQFGQRPVKVKPPKFLCAPAVKVFATPTPPAATQTATLTPTPVPTHTPGCDFISAASQCGGPCPPDNNGAPQQCVFNVKADGTAECDCQPLCHPAGLNTCTGGCPDPLDQCRLITVAGGTPDCVCTHPCQLDPPDPTLPPQCSGDCPVTGEVCVLNTANGNCDCHPGGGPTPCGGTTAPTCDGVCPNNGEACVPTGGPGSPCFCENGTPPACGQLAGNPQCLGACPANQACVTTGPVPGGSCTCQ